MAETGSDSELTLCGIVIPAKWGVNGAPTEVAILTRDEGEYRVAWLPPSDSPEWNPHAGSPDPWYSVHMAYVPPLLSSQPITSEEGIGRTSRPVERERLEQYIYYLLDSQKKSSVGSLLAMEN